MRELQAEKRAPTLLVSNLVWRLLSASFCRTLLAMRDATMPKVTSANGIPGATPLNGIVTSSDPSTMPQESRANIAMVCARCCGT